MLLVQNRHLYGGQTLRFEDPVVSLHRRFVPRFHGTESNEEVFARISLNHTRRHPNENDGQANQPQVPLRRAESLCNQERCRPAGRTALFSGRARSTETQRPTPERPCLMIAERQLKPQLEGSDIGKRVFSRERTLGTSIHK